MSVSKGDPAHPAATSNHPDASAGAWLTVCEADALPGAPPATYLWNGHEDSDAARSLFAYVERDGEYFRARYLNWIHGISERTVAGRSILSHLALNDGLSYWWLTQLSEKSQYSSPVEDVVRLFAIERLLTEKRSEGLRYVGSSTRLTAILQTLCERRRILFEHQPPSRGEVRPHSSPTALTLCLRTVRALIRLSWTAVRFRGADRSGWVGGDGATLFCDYFVNLNQEAADNGRYRSAYWGPLPKLFDEVRVRANWLHHNSAYPPGTSTTWVREFNRHGTEGFHTFLDAFWSVPGLVRIVGRWLGMVGTYFRLRDVSAAFRPAQSDLDLWGFARPLWRESLLGPTSIANLLAIELFDRALASAPRQDRGFYLMENAPWEAAFVHAWRKHGHGKVHGVAHSTVRFWDLRYGFDPGTRTPSQPLGRPAPDAAVVNGDSAAHTLASMGTPRTGQATGEALRYLYLEGSQEITAPRPGHDPLQLLVVADINADFTHRLLTVVDHARPMSTVPLSVHVKPHPARALDLSRYPSLGATRVSDPLHLVLPNFDIAVTSATTSGAVDAWLSGVRVLVFLDHDQLNLSPLRGCRGVSFVTSVDDLNTALAEGPWQGDRESQLDYFYLDSGLPRWRTLLTFRPQDLAKR